MVKITDCIGTRCYCLELHMILYSTPLAGCCAIRWALCTHFIFSKAKAPKDLLKLIYFIAGGLENCFQKPMLLFNRELKMNIYTFFFYFFTCWSFLFHCSPSLYPGLPCNLPQIYLSLPLSFLPLSTILPWVEQSRSSGVTERSSRQAIVQLFLPSLCSLLPSPLLLCSSPMAQGHVCTQHYFTSTSRVYYSFQILGCREGDGGEKFLSEGGRAGQGVRARENARAHLWNPERRAVLRNRLGIAQDLLTHTQQELHWHTGREKQSNHGNYLYTKRWSHFQMIPHTLHSLWWSMGKEAKVADPRLQLYHAEF